MWFSEIKGGVPNSQRGTTDNEDLRVIISKEEAVQAILAEDVEQFMKQSVDEGRTVLELVAGKVELFSKGYLDMYNALTGEEASVDYL